MSKFRTVTEMRRPVVLITGASTGVGLALGKLLISQNRFHVVLTARRESLQRFTKANVFESASIWLREMDILSKRQRDSVVYEIEKRLGGVDILVNNAAVMLSAVIEHVGEEERLRQIDVNFRAPLSLIRRVLPEMRYKGHGRIINISSVGGMMAMPTMGIYSASKFALEGATEALWYEVRPWNIKVTLVQPGFINSDGHEKFHSTRQSLGVKPHLDYFYQYEAMRPFVSRLMRKTNATPSTVAKRVLEVIESANPPLRVAGTWDAFFFGFMRRFLPRDLYHWLFWMALPAEVRRRAVCGERRKKAINTKFVQPEVYFRE